MKKWLLCCLLPVAVWATSYDDLDLKAKNTPWIMAKDKSTLVDYLTQDLKTDTEKARILAAFIAYQVDHNGYAEKRLASATAKRHVMTPVSDTAIFDTRVGDCRSYAGLFQELAQIAGLNVVKIDGYSGDKIHYTPYIPTTELDTKITKLDRKLAYPLQQYDCAWNAVMIDGEWRLLDVYRMDNNKKSFGADIRSDSAFYNALRKRMEKRPKITTLTQGKSLNNRYFLADPKWFAATHFPNESKWQLIRYPITWTEFTY